MNQSPPRKPPLMTDKTTPREPSAVEAAREYLENAYSPDAALRRAVNVLLADHARLSEAPPLPQDVAGMIDLLREQHQAMADVMTLRRLSSSPEQRAMAESAIAVWKKVKDFLAALSQQPASVDLDVEITQEDRDAAADYYTAHDFPTSARCARDGSNDRDHLVQAFRDHRVKSALARTSHAREAALRDCLNDAVGFIEHMSQVTNYPADEEARYEFDDKLARYRRALFDQPAHVQPVEGEG